MSILDLNLDNVVEPQPVEKGEYRLRVVSAEVKTSQKGNDYIAVSFEIADQPNTSRVFENFMLPTPGDSPDVSNYRLLAIKRFMEAFNIPITSPIDLDSFLGAEGWALLDVEEDETYGNRNRIKRFIKGA